MDYKTLLVHVGDQPGSAKIAGAAAALARRFGATLAGVGAIPWQAYLQPAASEPAGELLDRVVVETERRLGCAEQIFREAAQGLPAIWCSEELYPDEAMAKYACGADLLIAPRPNGRIDIRYEVRPGDLLMSVGAPVLVVPPASKPWHGESVVVGWKRTREAERAISAALPLLKQAKDVAVVSAPEHGLEPDEAEVACVLGRLRRHGIPARLVDAPAEASPGQALRSIADRHCADLIVCGAYGRPRALEWAFGGVTQHLLEQATQYVLFSR